MILHDLHQYSNEVITTFILEKKKNNVRSLTNWHAGQTFGIQIVSPPRHWQVSQVEMRVTPPG